MDTADQLEASTTRSSSASLLRAADRLMLISIWLLLLVSVLSGCAMDKPVSLEVEEGGLEVDHVGRVWGKGLRYRTGLLEAGEAAATFDGKATGFPATGPSTPPPAPPSE